MQEAEGCPLLLYFSRSWHECYYDVADVVPKPFSAESPSSSFIICKDCTYIKKLSLHLMILNVYDIKNF